MRLYRAMCEAEYTSVCKEFPFSWNSKCKWFSDDIDFINSRVIDGKFNNSNHVSSRYDYLVCYTVNDTYNKLKRVSKDELMLYRKDVPNLRVLSVDKIGKTKF